MRVFPSAEGEFHNLKYDRTEKLDHFICIPKINLSIWNTLAFNTFVIWKSIFEIETWPKRRNEATILRRPDPHPPPSHVQDRTWYEKGFKEWCHDQKYYQAQLNFNGPEFIFCQIVGRP